MKMIDHNTPDIYISAIKPSRERHENFLAILTDFSIVIFMTGLDLKFGYQDLIEMFNQNIGNY